MNRLPKPSISAIACCLALMALAFAPRALAQTKDVCSLVVAADVEAVLGEPVRAPMKESFAVPASTCRFLPSQGAAKYLSVMLLETDAVASVSDFLKRLGFGNVREVPGVGVEAAWGSRSMAGKIICQMDLRKDKHTLIMISINGLPDDADTLNRVKTLANQVLSKIGAPN